MDTVNTKFQQLVNTCRYFNIMSKQNSITNQQRVTSLKELKEEFLNNCYSPMFDSMHLLFLGLLHDATYMLKQEITQTKTKTNNETTVPVKKKIQHWFQNL